MQFELAQALDLAQLVELEAGWENLRRPSHATSGPNTPRDLVAIQQAFDSYHSWLAAYNRRYRQAHVPEPLLSTPAKLRRWCESMATLFRTIEGDAGTPCPVNVVEKAYRRAKYIAGRLNQDPPSRRPTPQTIQAAIEDLRLVAVWCASSLAKRSGAA